MRVWKYLFDTFRDLSVTGDSCKYAHRHSYRVVAMALPWTPLIFDVSEPPAPRCTTACSPRRRCPAGSLLHAMSDFPYQFVRLRGIRIAYERCAANDALKTRTRPGPPMVL